MSVPKVLIACECSGIVRDAFIKEGIKAISCDIQPSVSPGPHYQCDVLKVLNYQWDAMIAFPDCTYLTYAGTSVWMEKGRSLARAAACYFVAQLWEADIPFICIENPQGLLSSFLRKPDQQIHPSYFGDDKMKRTDLWLRRLPKLLHSPLPTLFEDQTHNQEAESYIEEVLPSDFQQIKRSTISPYIARAMASQWAPLLHNYVSTCYK